MLLQDFQARLVSQPTEWEKIFANDMTDKDLISKICKKLIQLNDDRKNKNNNSNKNQLKMSIRTK